jgi:hypothetical protein
MLFSNCIQVIGYIGTYTNFGFVVTQPVDAGLFIGEGNPVDVSGWTITFRVKKNSTDPDSSAVYITSWTIQNGTAGVVQDGVPAAITTTLSPQNYWWSMTAVVGSGDPQELFSGIYTLLPG